MPSSFMVKRNHANRPLKKRPLALYNEPAVLPEQEEPQDLSVKRPRTQSPPPPPSEVRKTPVEEGINYEPSEITTVERFGGGGPYYNTSERYHHLAVYVPAASPSHHESHFESNHLNYHPSTHIITPPPMPLVPDVNKAQNECHLTTKNECHSTSVPASKPENLPSLAEYYLQLFRATSEAEKKKPVEQTPMRTSPSNWYLPPSPQSSPVNLHQFSGATEFSDLSPQPSPNYPFSQYPESSALISPVSVCSSTGSEDEEESATGAPVSTKRGGVRHTCDACGKSYSTFSGLTKHTQLHCISLGARTFSCIHCYKSYTSVGALKMHIRTHTLPCKCHLCGKAFSRPWLLQGHIRTHTGEKPFECGQCGRSFADRSNLRAHAQTHAHVKKYACGGCHKTFSRMSLLNKHCESSCLVMKPPILSPNEPSATF